MALNDLLPSCIHPCLRDRDSSLESVWLNQSDFGECFPQQLEGEAYPCLTPVYNGQPLNIHSEFVHASLSGISIKHYHGKCFREEPEEEVMPPPPHEDIGMESYGFYYFGSERESTSCTSEEIAGKGAKDLYENQTTSQGFSMESLEGEGPEQPLCTIPKINFRNSFWNIHQPEMCKLTWKQQYVSTATVTDHLHEHLLSHGRICAGMHEREDRAFLLDRELDEYVRLKELVAPRVLSPDEKLFNFKDDPLSRFFDNPRCKALGKTEIKSVISPKERFLALSDDDDVEQKKSIHRSREEFCLTIGKHVRRPPVKSISVTESPVPRRYSYAPEEEDDLYFHYGWFLYQGEESSGGEPSDKTPSEADEDIQLISSPCPPLGLDELCRAAGRADFSDLRCNPDDF